MKNLIGLIIAILVVTNLNAQSIYSELRDGLVDKNYESFSLLDPTKEVKPNSAEALIISEDYMAQVTTYTVPDFPSVEVKKQVENAIKHELITQDYKHQESNGEMLVSYLIFNREGTLQGDFSEDEAYGLDKEEYEVKKGTLLISIIDKESGATVCGCCTTTFYKS
ncbi:hypothetical protein [Marivirga sp.]|uniref:hypothetical protein n=1 Tax=Marivirga sp. TaxID=2018662 RepID=UPI002D804299|nr:hypothetical protein [Marivirga sp.]HET8858809.1 hypothetical protein [Marivirga sp.]